MRRFSGLGNKCGVLVIIICVGYLLNAGCSSDKGTSYSILATGQIFSQATTNSQIDILWVVDNSGSMSPLQENMANNFNSFMNDFVAKGFDFHLAVASSEAYLAGAAFRNEPELAKFRDGAGSTHTGIFTILPGTLDLINVFITNSDLGAGGSGDERAFSSFKASLDSPLNAGFLREKSFLAVIILSDEDDYSDPNRREYSWIYQGGVPDHNYTNPGLETVDSYIAYLDTLTNTSGALRRYSLNAITVPDQACQDLHVMDAPASTIGLRYTDIVNKTGGVLGSVCDTSYADSLKAIQQRIIELGTQFYLSKPPIPESIRVTINGAVVAQSTINGWSYNAPANSVIFHGSAVPPAGAAINITFDPASVIF